MISPPGTSYRDGLPLRVIRPNDSTIPLQLAREAVAGRFNLDELPMEAERRGVAYSFAGWLTTSGRIVDNHGVDLGGPQAGDSFVTAAGDL